jgi:hypothetical protein
MAKSKEVSSKNVTFVKGGKTKMFSEQEAGAQKPGVSGHTVPAGEQQFASGGKGKMFGFRPSSPAKPGCSAPD